MLEHGLWREQGNTEGEKKIDTPHFGSVDNNQTIKVKPLGLNEFAIKLHN